MNIDAAATINTLQKAIQNSEAMLRRIQASRKKLEQELHRLRHDRVTGVLEQRIDPKEIVTKERRVREIKKELDQLKRDDTQTHSEIAHRKLDLHTLQSLQSQAKYGNQHAMHQIKRLLWRV